MTKKCVECGTQHHNSNGGEVVGDRCFNCQIVVDMLNAFVNGINQNVPLNGRPRKLTITGYKIEKI